MAMTGLGWRADAAAPAVAAALDVRGAGAVLEFEDVALSAGAPAALLGADGGAGAARALLALPPMVQLGGLPANFTVAGPQGAFERLLLFLSAAALVFIACDGEREREGALVCCL